MKFKILVLKIAFSSEIFKKLEIDFASQHFNIQYLIFPKLVLQASRCEFRGG